MPVRYDCAVVGSSPLLLMMALQLSRSGRSVALFESENQLGGAWQVEDVEGVGPVECACHLIEWYKGGYDLLQELSGTSFVPSDPQPVRVTPSGKNAPYTSRVDIARTLYWSIRGLAGALLRRIAARPHDRAAKDAILEISLRELMFFLRYRLPGLVAYDAIRRPADGYIGFVANLCRQVEDSAINIVPKHVDRIETRQAEAALWCGDHMVLADKVYIGESTITEGLNEGTSASPTPINYYHIVVALPADRVRLRNDYVHLPDDPVFHRITYVRDNMGGNHGPSCVFLVQLRKPLDEISNFEIQVGLLLARCNIADSADGLAIHKVFTKLYMQRSDTISQPGSESIVQRLRTIGDLSRNLLFHAKHFKIKKKR